MGVQDSCCGEGVGHSRRKGLEVAGHYLASEECNPAVNTRHQVDHHK